LDTLAAVRFLSCEPLLEDLDCTKLGMWLRQGIHWVIVGGESGPRRREFRTEWAHNIFDVCRAMDVPVFFKQGSGLKPGMHDTLPGVGKVKEWPV
jgi:protein gp37